MGYDPSGHIAIISTIISLIACIGFNLYKDYEKDIKDVKLFNDGTVSDYVLAGISGVISTLV